MGRRIIRGSVDALKDQFRGRNEGTLFARIDQGPGKTESGPVGIPVGEMKGLGKVLGAFLPSQFLIGEITQEK